MDAIVVYEDVFSSDEVRITIDLNEIENIDVRVHHFDEVLKELELVESIIDLDNIELRF